MNDKDLKSGTEGEGYREDLVDLPQLSLSRPDIVMPLTIFSIISGVMLSLAAILLNSISPPLWAAESNHGKGKVALLLAPLSWSEQLSNQSQGGVNLYHTA